MAQTFTPSEAPWGEDDPFLANPYDFYAWGREHSPLRVEGAQDGAWSGEVQRIHEAGGGAVRAGARGLVRVPA